MQGFRDPLPVLTAIFVLAVVAIAWAAETWSTAVYALSFWHYLVYALAYFFREISLKHFKRDAIILKSVSVAALAYVFLTTWPNLLSIMVISAGFALNISAARALGADRTYYGFEIGALPPERLNVFPFSVMSHPMLIGNVIAYGGMLLDSGLRADWWPLAVLHVLLNVAIIFQEAYGDKNRLMGATWSITTFLLGSLCLLFGYLEIWPFALAIIVISLGFGLVILRQYSKRRDGLTPAT